MYYIRPVVELLKELGVEDAHQKVEAAVVVRDEGKDGCFLFSKAPKLHFVRLGDTGQRGKVEFLQPGGQGDLDGFEGLTTARVIRPIVFQGNVFRASHFQPLKELIQRGAEALVILPYLTGLQHLHDHGEVLLFRRGLIVEIEHQRHEQHHGRLIPEGVGGFAVLGGGVSEQVGDHLADSKKQLDSDTEAIQAAAQQKLCTMSTLNWQQMDGLNTALPLGIRKIDALRTLTTESLAVFMPFMAQEIRDRGGVYYGQHAISRNLIMANRLDLLNGNGYVLGISGSGKSLTVKREILPLVLGTDADILIMDPESEYGPLVRAMGGEVINISASSANHINALDMEQGYGDGENPVVLKSEFILSLCEQLVGSGKLSAKEKSIIDRCTSIVYMDHIRNGCKGTPPTLQDFYKVLLDQREPEARDVALAMELFTEGSLNTFAKPTNVDTNSRIICYDIRDLGKQLLPVGMLVVLDSIFNRVLRNRKLGKITWIYIDEIYLLFQHEYSANFLFALWKRVRKYGACATGVTQNVDDLLQSHTARTMLANSEFIVMLNQAGTDRTELARLLNISDNQLTHITDVPAGHGLLKCGSAIVPFVDEFPKDTQLYKLMTTKPEEVKEWS